MIVTCVTIHVKVTHVADFIQATIENHSQSIQEEGNLRFDFLQAKTDPARFFLYEAYATEAAAAAHKQTAHYLKWRQAVEPWMAKPREGIAHSVICPAGVDQW